MYRELVENLSYGIILLDDNMKIQYTNKYIKNIFRSESTDENYKGKICGEAFLCVNTLARNGNCGKDKECLTCTLKESLSSIKNGKIEESKLCRIIREDGSVIRFRIKGYKMLIEGEESIVIEIQNAEKEDNLIKLSEKIGIWNRKLERVLDKLQDQVFVLDENLNYIYVNNALCNAVGMKKDDIIGKNDYHLVPAEMAKICYENSRYALENGDYSKEDFLEGECYHVLKGRVEISKEKYGVFGIIKNITEERKKERNYERKIYVDALTGLYNRNFYEERAEDIFIEAKRDNDDFSVLILDVDDFKGVNDIYGHHLGDLVLQKLSKVIKKNIRRNDYAIRIGGDEMMILLNATSEIAGQIGERIIQEINSIEIEGIQAKISVGVATRTEEMLFLRDLSIPADKALYESKKQGKNTLSHYN